MKDVWLTLLHDLINCKSESNEQKKIMPNDNLTNSADDYLVESNFNYNEDDNVSENDKTLQEGEEYEIKGGITLVKSQKPRIIHSVRFNKSKDLENYCREHIMLYTSWRIEKKDLLKDFQSYQDRLKAVKDVIEKNRQGIQG